MQVPIQRCSMIHSGRQEGVVTRTGKKHAPNNGMVNIPRSGALAELHFPSNGFGSLTSFIFRAPKRQLTHLFNFFSFFLPFFYLLKLLISHHANLLGFFFIFRFAPVCFENFFFCASNRKENKCQGNRKDL